MKFYCDEIDDEFEEINVKLDLILNKINGNKSNKFNLINTKLKGLYYHKDNINFSGFGKIRVSLVNDIDNPYDKFAVKVMHDGNVIGYVPKEISELIHNINNISMLKLDCNIVYCKNYDYDLIIDLIIGECNESC